jgi:Uma2 family endonuclease
MATTVEPGTRAFEPERRFVLPRLGWHRYEAMLDILGDLPIRITYDRGDLELMSPSYDHERFKRLLGRIVETVAEEFRIPYVAAGSTTWRRKAEDRGLEADDCFYLASQPRIRGKTPDLGADPPPDLAIEVEISRSALDRMGIYAVLGVPEVWRFDGETLRVEQLQADGAYVEAPASLSLPMLPLEEAARWLNMSAATEDQGEWALGFREWVRATLVAGGGGR